MQLGSASEGAGLSKWQEDKAKANRLAIARLTKSLPPVFPSAVLARALNCRFVPLTPRLAIDGYWRAHPLRADRLARALAARSGAPSDWRWQLTDDRSTGLPTTYRSPPAPYREQAHAKGAGFCCVCGQPVYRFGWHVDLWNAGVNKNASWHSACVIAWQFWNAPSGQTRLLRRLQGLRCRDSNRRLLRAAEVDHRVPLFQVWRQHRDLPWPELLGYWGLPNLQVINREIHVAKCATEARNRRAARSATVELA
ncbi:hypothetical protein SAMN05444123_10431 [Rhodopseudomonas pseudopalustris]|uniref:Uncharacterized protein n=1 Tax=Rhodopseudomonas pseudopalustris TaxID=1513892 RepID=A0A1H8RNI7_9BRAD|nr:hypothetical protein SAMN05444123_10431 [Rhodopseudomonas pseudopalustris]